MKFLICYFSNLLLLHLSYVCSSHALRSWLSVCAVSGQKKKSFALSENNSSKTATTAAVATTITTRF